MCEANTLSEQVKQDASEKHAIRKERIHLERLAFFWKTDTSDPIFPHWGYEFGEPPVPFPE